ncbi:MAG TPA: hypothetical protein VFT74_21560, partial [Isosphaeraceae bacterium]|nr:hypothetical protein [Isosphaeraceae bacterium]
MSDEKEKPDDGILGKTRRLANQIVEYARSDEAREKISAAKKKAADVGGRAAVGARKLAEGTKQAAVQAKNKADELSKSEQAQAIKAKAKEEWDEIKGRTFRGTRLSQNRVIVGLAIFLFFPVGLYLLWRHPVLGHSKKWWWAGGAWGFLVILALRGGGGNNPSSPLLPVVTTRGISGDGGTSSALPRTLAARAIDCQGDGGSVESLSFSNDGRFILVGRSKGAIEGYDVTSGARRFSVRLAGERRPIKAPGGDTVFLEDVPEVGVSSFSIDGRSVAAWHQGFNSVKAWDVESLKECEPSMEYLATTDGSVSIAGT